MKSMEVLLREPVANLGIPGDVVKVASGYARNYLLPQRLAVRATEHNKREVAKRKAEYEIEMAEKAKEINALIESFAGLELKTTEKTDEKGGLYGSVNAARIVELLAGAGKTIEEKQVRLAAPIKAIGEYEVEIHIHEDKNATVKLVVESEGGVAEPAPAEPATEEPAETTEG